jgi:hypothetical protein
LMQPSSPQPLRAFLSLWKNQPIGNPSNVNWHLCHNNPCQWHSVDVGDL